MRVRSLALVLSALFAGCVQSPLGPQLPFDYAHMGVPLSPSEIVAIFLSTEVSPGSPREPEGQVSPIASPALVLEGITAGFRALPSDVRISVGDESLRRACFDASTEFARGGVVPAPDPGRSECRALVGERGIRYLVSVAGYRWIGQGDRTGSGMRWETPQIYALTARAFDATNGVVVCEEAEQLRTTSSFEVFWLYVPIPAPTDVDEPAYWKRAAWNIGNKVRSCFLQPSATSSNHQKRPND